MNKNRDKSLDEKISPYEIELLKIMEIDEEWAIRCQKGAIFLQKKGLSGTPEELEADVREYFDIYFDALSFWKSIRQIH